MTLALLSLAGLFLLYYGKNQSKTPTITITGNGIDDKVYLSIEAGYGAKVYYSIDGSSPTRDSILYNGPILLEDASFQDNRLSARDDLSVQNYEIPKQKVDKAWCIKAKAFYSSTDEGSKETIKNYLVKPDNELNTFNATDILYVTVNPQALTDYETGMMVRGAYFDGYLREEGLDFDDVVGNTKDALVKANYSGRLSDKFTKNAHIEYVRDGEILYSDTVAIKNRGVSSSDGPKKTYNLNFDEDISKNLFDKRIFECGTQQDKVVLRREDCILRDSLYEKLYKDTDMIISDAGNPVQVFINGEYWGLYSFEEKMDENWFSTHLGIPGDKVTVIKNGSVSFGNYKAEDEFFELIDFCDENNLSDSKNYDYFCGKVDIDSFLLYYASMFYLDACDFLETYNTMQWRVEGDKWHWALYDLDNSANDATQDTLNEELKWDKDNAICTHTMFSAVMQNVDAQRLFIEKVDECKRILSSQRVKSVLEGEREALVLAGINDSRRWGFDINWDEQINSVEDFFEERPKYVDEFVQRYMKGL